MKKYFKSILAVSLISVSIISCNSDDGDNEFYNNTLNYESLTSFSTYYLKNIQAEKPIDLTGNGISSVDVYNQLENCKKDDVYHFINQQNTISNGNYAYVNDEGDTKCDATDNQRVSEGTFVLNGKTLTMKDIHTNSDKVFQNVQLSKFRGADGTTEARLTFDYYINNVKVTYTLESVK